MQLWDAIREMVRESGKSMYSASKAMGRSPQYLSSCANVNRNVGLEVMAEICDACDSDLIVRNVTTGKEFIIDVPSAEDSAQDEPQPITAHVTFTMQLDKVPERCCECPFADVCDGRIANLTKRDGIEWSRLAMNRKPKRCPMVIDG